MVCVCVCVTMAKVAKVTMTVRITELSMAAGKSAAEPEEMEFDHGRWKLQGRIERPRMALSPSWSCSVAGHR